MEVKTFLIIGCLTFAFVVNESHGLKCYVCANCPDPFNKDADGIQQMDCQSGSCLKTKGKIPGVGEGVARACAPAKVDDKCDSQSSGGASVTVCGCSSDLCNSATTSTVSVTALLSLMAAIFMYKKVM